MSSMSALLADVFQTKTASAAAHTTEDLTKQAEYEFFGALCRQEGIDVSALPDAKVEELFKVAMEMKAASDEHEEKETPKEEKIEEAAKEKAKEKEAAAHAEYREKRAAATKVAEAEAMGRIMAHAYVDEMKKIAEAAEEAGKDGKSGFPFGKKDGKKDDKEEKEKEASARANELIAAFEQMKTASAPAAGTTTTPNFDEFAAQQAIELLKQAQVDEDVAYARVNAVWTLGLPESTKMASATSEAKALEYRALEICDAAGFQVDWTQVA